MREPETIEYSLGFVGGLREANLMPSLPIDTMPTLEKMLKQKGLYESRIGKFQVAIAATADNVFERMPLPENVERSDMVEAAVRILSTSLKQRQTLLKAIEGSSRYRTSDAQRFRTALVNIRKMFEEYKLILSESEKAEFLSMLHSQMPSSYFNESVLAYRSIAFFLEREGETIYNRLNRAVVYYRNNQRRFQPALSKIEGEIDSEMLPFSQLMLHYIRLRSYVNLWNGKGPDAAFIRPDSLDYGKLDSRVYSELFRLLNTNILLFRNRIAHDYPKQYYNAIERKHDPVTQTMWKELLQPLVAQ